MPSILYDTAFEVALSTGFILYCILVCACIAAEMLRDHLSSGCVEVRSFPHCATKGNPWIYCYIKQYFAVGIDIYVVSIYKLLL
jgi:hypothetical protein